MRTMRRLTRGVLSGRALYVVVAVGVIGVALVLANETRKDGVPQSDPAQSKTAPSRHEKDRIREGTVQINLLGHFEMTGDRVAFVTKGQNRRFGALENLNLQRVVEIISDNPDKLDWVVSGSMTEYQGNNFILLQRAVLKNTVSRPGG